MSVDEKTALARRFVAEVTELAAKYGLNFFVVTDGTSGIRNSGNPAVEHARKAHMEWKRKRRRFGARLVGESGRIAIINIKTGIAHTPAIPVLTCIYFFARR